MTGNRVQKNHPLRAALVTLGLIVLTAVAAINASVDAHDYGARCASVSNPGFSEQFTCTFVRISLGDLTLPDSFIFTTGFWLTLFLFSIPTIGAALLTRRAYRGSSE